MRKFNFFRKSKFFEKIQIFSNPVFFFEEIQKIVDEFVFD